MDQKVESHNTLDANGNPTGGTVVGVGISISWQNGPLGRTEDGTRVLPNGAFTEGVINAVIERIEFYQSTKFNCEENAKALEHLYAAKAALNSRTQKREAQKVEGTHAVHA